MINEDIGNVELSDVQVRALVMSLMVGQTIMSVNLSSYMKWNPTIDSITLSNGVKINFGGNAADLAHIVDIEMYGESIAF